MVPGRNRPWRLEDDLGSDAPGIGVVGGASPVGNGVVSSRSGMDFSRCCKDARYV
jgi:hypothetical protein